MISTNADIYSHTLHFGILQILVYFGNIQYVRNIRQWDIDSRHNFCRTEHEVQSVTKAKVISDSCLWKISLPAFITLVYKINENYQLKSVTDNIALV